MLPKTMFTLAYALAQAATVANPPDLTLPPETAHLVVIVEGRGDQIYSCSRLAGSYAWTLKEPEAGLFNLATGAQVGNHAAGPTWTFTDGSAVRGTVLQKKAADAATDVPWLLLRAEPIHAADGSPGMLTPVTMVRRYNTRGGNPPAAGCDAAHESQTLRVPYSAMYAFYGTQGAVTKQP